MTTFVLLPGAGSDSWFWHSLTPLLEAEGHRVIAVDLPWADESAGLDEYADVIVDSVDASGSGGGARGGAGPIVLVAQSMSAFAAVIVCERLDVSELVLVAAMIPVPGETPGQWWQATGQEAAMRAFAVEEGRDPDAPFSDEEIFLHDVSASVIAESAAHEPGGPAAAPFESVWAAASWPDVPTRVIAGRYDRLFPLEFMQRISRERLGIDPEVIDTGHLTALSRPDQLAALLVRGING
jgi:pimeloyl-ACP methyl ester carboxylesterase